MTVDDTNVVNVPSQLPLKIDAFGKIWFRFIRGCLRWLSIQDILIWTVGGREYKMDICPLHSLHIFVMDARSLLFLVRGKPRGGHIDF